MFDISFAELLLIAIIGLLVIGPQRLPETIRALALWIGRLRRGITRAYRDIEKEVGMDDIRRQLHNEEIMRQLNGRTSSSTPPPRPPGDDTPVPKADTGGVETPAEGAEEPQTPVTDNRGDSKPVDERRGGNTP